MTTCPECGSFDFDTTALHGRPASELDANTIHRCRNCQHRFTEEKWPGIQNQADKQLHLETVLRAKTPTKDGCCPHCDADAIRETSQLPEESVPIDTNDLGTCKECGGDVALTNGVARWNRYQEEANRP